MSKSERSSRVDSRGNGAARTLPPPGLGRLGHGAAVWVSVEGLNRFSFIVLSKQRGDR